MRLSSKFRLNADLDQASQASRRHSDVAWVPALPASDRAVHALDGPSRDHLEQPRRRGPRGGFDGREACQVHRKRLSPMDKCSASVYGVYGPQVLCGAALATSTESAPGHAAVARRSDE